MGIVGLILWIAMSIAVLVYAWKAVRKLKDSPWFPLAFMIFWYVFLLFLPFTFVGLQAYEDFVLNAYAWVLLGILFRLPTLVLSAQFAAGAPAEQPAQRWIRLVANRGSLPFVDRRHGTERALSELLERLAQKYGCEVHLYSERVEDLQVSEFSGAGNGRDGAIFWHRVPTIRGPHLLRFISWVVLNTVMRRSHRVFQRISCDLVMSPGINCVDADVVIVHALFHRLWKLARVAGVDNPQRVGVLRSKHRRAYYGLLTALEVRVYANRKVSLLAVSRRTANLLQRYFHRKDVAVVPNGVDTEEFSLPARLAGRKAARRRRKLDDEDFVLLLIGNDWRVKGLGSVLEAMAALPDLPLQLIVAGNDEGSYFYDEAKRVGVLERCRWEEPRYDVLDLYSAADVYVSPSHEGFFWIASGGGDGLRVASDYVGFRGEFSGQIHHGVDGFVVPDPNDARLLAHLLERLHRDTDFRQYVGEAAARTARIGPGTATRRRCGSDSTSSLTLGTALLAARPELHQGFPKR